MPLRQPVVAGRFYTAVAEKLRQEVTVYLGQATADALEPLMVMLPHAGYVYCGGIIGKTLERVRLPQRVILLGPNHTGRGQPLAVWPEGAWLTPLGSVGVAGELAHAVLETGAGFVPDVQAHVGEHSLEVLLPFLQIHTPDIQIVPVTVSATEGALRTAGEALGALLRREKEGGRPVALVVSSDMNHYADQQTTLRKDEQALERLLALDPEGLYRTVRENSISMCGVCPATLALHACGVLGARAAAVVHHGTSGDITGDGRQVVGYAGVLVHA